MTALIKLTNLSDRNREIVVNIDQIHALTPNDNGSYGVITSANITVPVTISERDKERVFRLGKRIFLIPKDWKVVALEDLEKTE